MISKGVINVAKVILRDLANMLGFIIPLPDWVDDGIGYLRLAVSDAASLLKWVIPNEGIYNWLLASAIIVFSAWLMSKLIGFVLKLYDIILI